MEKIIEFFSSNMYFLVGFVIMIFLTIAFYLIFSISLFKISKKENVLKPIFGFIPILNIYLFFTIGLRNKNIALITTFLLILPLFFIFIQNTIFYLILIAFSFIFSILSIICYFKILKRYSDKYVIFFIISFITGFITLPIFMLLISKNNSKEEVKQNQREETKIVEEETKIVEEETKIVEEKKENKEDLEVLNLSDEKVNLTTDKENKLTNRILIITFIILIIFIFLLPSISSFFKDDNKFSSINKVSSSTIKNNNTNRYELYKKVGGNDTVSIDPFEFYKIIKEDKELRINYVSKKDLKTSSESNIYIELFDQYKKYIKRVKFEETDIVKKEVYTYKLKLSDQENSLLTYVRIKIISSTVEAETPVVNKDTSTGESILTCSKTINESGTVYKNNITYYFLSNKLSRYKVLRDLTNTITTIDSEEFEKADEIYSKYGNEIIEEEDQIFKTNLEYYKYESNYNETTDIETQSMLEYTIDFSIFDKKESDYKLLYEKNKLLSDIYSAEVKKGWVCK